MTMATNITVTLVMVIMVVHLPWAAIANSPCFAEERAALLRFKASVTSDPSSHLSSWIPSTDCCSWAGVICDPNSGHVISIDLAVHPENVFDEPIENYSVTGTLPPDSLLSLPRLVSLDLTFLIHLSGSLPSSLPSTLTTLLLSTNSFAGPLPSFEMASSLSILDLSSNLFSGSIPPSLSSIKTLTDLRLSKLPLLSGALPDSWGSLYNLQYLTLQGSGVSGAIPTSLGSLPMLRSLELSHTMLSGPIPASFGHLSSLDFLRIVNTSISGTIPRSIGNLSNLQYFELSQNNLLAGRLPDTLGDLSNLNFLRINCPLISGAIPASFGKLTNLMELTISHARIHGPLPMSLGNLTHLRYLDLSYNRINGILPPSLGDLSDLLFLKLHHNRLGGPIPSAFNRNLTNVYQLYLQHNQITGVARNLSNMRSLQDIDLSFNKLGSIENLRGLTNLPKLSSLSASHCQLRGPIPGDWILSLDLKYGDEVRMERTLDLSDNVLSGNIPVELGYLGYNLLYLNLSRNQLSGNLPASLGQLKNVFSMDLSLNRLSGTIPASFIQLRTLYSFNISHNQLTGPIPAGEPFISFPASSYAANSGLCGSPLPACKS